LELTYQRSANQAEATQKAADASITFRHRPDLIKSLVVVVGQKV